MKHILIHVPDEVAQRKAALGKKVRWEDILELGIKTKERRIKSVSTKKEVSA